MKRLITILISFMGYVSLFGQAGVPVLVAGDVYVKAPFRSEGNVLVFADSTDLHKTGKITIDKAAGSQLGADTIILYSNHLSDGLLMNKNTNGVKERKLDLISGPDVPKVVIIRKQFIEGTLTYMAFPFNVKKENVKRGGTNVSLVANVDANSGSDGYWAWQFDAEERSNAVSGDPNAHWLLFDNAAYNRGFLEGNGYLLYYENATNGHHGGDVDFVTTEATDIARLFSLDAKMMMFDIYGDDLHDKVADGWAFLGGLYTTTYTYSEATVDDYDGVIYHRAGSTSHGIGQKHHAFEQVNLSDPTKHVSFGPYTPFYIHCDVAPGSTNPVQSSITYHEDGAGLSIESSIFRSAQAERKIKDMLYFELLSKKNNTSDNFYLTFSDNYAESFRAIEDAVTMVTVADDKPTAWTIDGSNKNLFVNGLPSLKNEQRIVKVGFAVPEAGDYQFTVDTRYREDVKNVILEDRVTKKKVDLLQYPYSFSSEALGYPNSERFVLYINSQYTDIPSVESGQPYAFVKDNLLTVKNLTEGDKVLVYDLTGRAIISDKASGQEFSAVLGQKGVYVVNVQAKDGKTSILKVLNK